MEYHGKLYGKFNGKPFDTGKTSDDFDKLVKENEEMRAMLEKVTDLLDCGFPNIKAVKESKELLNKLK